MSWTKCNSVFVFLVVAYRLNLVVLLYLSFGKASVNLLGLSAWLIQETISSSYSIIEIKLYSWKAKCFQSCLESCLDIKIENAKVCRDIKLYCWTNLASLRFSYRLIFPLWFRNQSTNTEGCWQITVLSVLVVTMHS